MAKIPSAPKLPASGVLIPSLSYTIKLCSKYYCGGIFADLTKDPDQLTLTQGDYLVVLPNHIAL